MDEIISFENIHYIYNARTRTGVTDISFKVKQGGVYSLIGPNGSGKTTILKLIINILKKQKGKVMYFGKDEPFSNFRKYVAYIPDTDAIWDNLTGKEFVSYVCALYKVVIPGDFETQLNSWFELFDLKGRENHLLQDYSFRMKKKIQIIAGFLRSPLILILDEPIFGLDPFSVILLISCFKKYVQRKILFDGQELSPCIIVTSHQMVHVRNFSKDLIFLSEGKIILSSKIEKIVKDKTLEEVFIEKAGKQLEFESKERLIDQLIQV